MSFFKKVAGLFSGSRLVADNALKLYARCNRCGEVLMARVNLANDLSQADDDGYFARKVLIGSNRCFQRIEIGLHFDKNRRLTEREISGGEFVSEADYRPDAPGN